MTGDRRDAHEALHGTLLGAKGVVFFARLPRVTAFLLARSVFGRYVYAVGDNAEAARLSGVRVMSCRRAATSSPASPGGSRACSPRRVRQRRRPNSSSDLEFPAIAAAVVGGTSIFGGSGAVWRGVLGVLILALIGNGFNLLGIDTTYQLLVQGVLILPPWRATSTAGG